MKFQEKTDKEIRSLERKHNKSLSPLRHEIKSNLSSVQLLERNL